MMNDMNKLAKKEVWNTEHEKLYIEIVHWGIEHGELESMNDGHGVWNYYVTLPERILKDRFREVWLEDKEIQIVPESPVRITHDYMSAPFADVDWHGGITYYEKHGQVEGHRTVQLGCDYNHLYDMERGYGYSLEEVLYEAKQTAEQLAKLYGIC